MPVRKFICLLLALACLAFCASAQSVTLDRRGDGYSGSSKGSSRGMMGKPMSPTKLDADAGAVSHGRYNDEGLKKLEKEMAERDWASEDTAWARAREMDTVESYQRYIAIYPNGPHRAEATQRLIDKNVDNVFNSNHGGLPQMKYVAPDEDSPTSTITIHNETRYPLTVWYSGETSQSTVIIPGSFDTITVENGHYRIAASVPPFNVRPFAGTEYFRGGHYEVSFYVVSSMW